MDEDEVLLGVFGIQVIAARLGQPVLFFRSHNIALIDADLTPDERHRVLDRLVSHVARQADQG